MLNPHPFNVINQQWGPFDIDRFATRLTRQLPEFYNRRPVPESTGVDALVQDWRHMNGYVHSPWCLIGRVLQKVLAQGVTVTLIAPVWPSKPWYLTLLSLLVELPLLLPQEPQTIILYQNCSAPMQDSCPQLAAWKISGNNFCKRSYG